MTNQANQRVVQDRLKLIERYGGKCWFEGCDESDPSKLQFAHIFPTGLNGRGRGRKERTYDVSKNPGNYALMCKFHHGLLDDTLESLDHGRSILGLPYLFLKTNGVPPKRREN